MFKIPKMNGWTKSGLVLTVLAAYFTFVGRAQDDEDERKRKEANDEKA